MNPLPSPPHVLTLFPSPRGPRTMHVAMEQEFLTSDAADGSVVGIERARNAMAGATYVPWLSFEPGGQVELSLPPSPTVAALDRRWRPTDLAVRADCLVAGVQLMTAPIDHERTVANVPLQLRSARYLRMQRHFDSIGPAGRRMMRLTASTQVCLDWWPGATGLEQWRLALLSGPVLAACFNRESGPGSRLANWLTVDPARTGFDTRLLGSDPVGAYAAFAAGATGFVDDPCQHLTTLFPPVRPRGRYLEFRYLDAQPADMVAPVAAVLASLLYDDHARRGALRILDRLTVALEGAWHDAALRPERLTDLADDLVGLSKTAMRNSPRDYLPPDVALRLRQHRATPPRAGSSARPCAGSPATALVGVA